MNTLLSCLLSMIVNSQSLPEMKPEEIPFSRLPEECAAEYDSLLRSERNAVSTNVLRRDLDGDGDSEMLIWTGESGSGGEVWSVMRHTGTQYTRAGQVFGCLFPLPPSPFGGLLVCTPCGWEQATWTFYQLRKEKLERVIEFEVRYSKPIRQKPSEIKIIYGKENK